MYIRVKMFYSIDFLQSSTVDKYQITCSRDEKNCGSRTPFQSEIKRAENLMSDFYKLARVNPHGLQAPNVQRLDKAIHRINRCPVNKY